MSLYAEWMKKMPKDALQDLTHLRDCGKPLEKKYFINSIDANGIREKWNIMSLVVCWDCPLRTKQKILREMILMGVDMDVQGLCGLNPLHVLILRVVFDHNKDDQQLLYHLIRSGADYNAKAFLSQDDMVYSPFALLDFVLHHPQNKWHRWMPRCHGRLVPAPFSDIEPTWKLLRILNEPMSVPIPLSELDHVERDMMRIRFKIPPHLSDREILNRARFAWQHKEHIHYEDVNNERRRQFDPSAVYLNSCFLEESEFLPVEFVRLEEGGRPFYFHRKMLPSIWKSHRNPFTCNPIPYTVLSQWYDEHSQLPFVYDITTLQESMCEDGFFGTNPTSDKIQDAYYYLYTLVMHSHPYSNIYTIATFSLPQLWHLCTFLMDHPFRIQRFQTILHIRDVVKAKMSFLSACFHLLQKGNFLHNLHFALEECLLDFQMTEQCRQICKSNGIVFNHDAYQCTMELYEMIMERVGIMDENSFQVVWRRLCSFHQISS